MKNVSIFGLFLTIFLVVPVAHSSADTALRMNDSITLSVDQTVEGDFYGFSGLAGSVSLSGSIEGDATVFGTTVTTNGLISGDLLALSGTAQVHASVTDDVRIVAGEVTIAEYVGGDVFVLGGILNVLSSAQIDGNIFFFGGQGKIEGVVGGSIFGTSEILRIDSAVAGSVDVTVMQSLVMGEKADITGDVTYESRNEMVRAQSAVIVGDVVRNAHTIGSVNPKDALVPFLVYAFSTLIMYLIFRGRLLKLLSDANTSFTRNGLIGAAGVFFLPAAVVLLLVTIIGSVVGLLGSLVVLAMYTSALLFVPIFVGFLIKLVISKKEEVTLLGTLGGIVVTELLFLVPIAGPIIAIALTIVLLGTILTYLYDWLV
ncbi:MAG: hypothetical protein ACI9VM_000373 [Candidatus Azotimanducaceae bacterium]|jgi:hypothetical protein